MSTESAEVPVEESPSLVIAIINEIIYSPINLGLVLIIAFLVYKIIKDRFEVPNQAGTQKAPEVELPKLRRDFTVAELRQFDGTQSDGRVLVAVNGKVYDVSKGKRFYGVGGPYHAFAGRDASRNLATFSVSINDKDDYDDLSDLSSMEMDSVREWEMQFKEKYDYVGKLLRPGEQPTNYDDEEETTSDDKKVESAPNTDTATSTAAATVTATDANETETVTTSATTDEGLRQRSAAPSTAEEVK